MSFVAAVLLQLWICPATLINESCHTGDESRHTFECHLMCVCLVGGRGGCVVLCKSLLVLDPLTLHVHVRLRMCVCAYVHVCVRLCICACVCVCV